jgi:hypothetical protein
MTNYVSSLVDQPSFYNLFIHPYADGAHHLKKACDLSFVYNLFGNQSKESSLSLFQRVKHLVAGAILLTPLVNTIFTVALRYLSQPKEENVHKVQFKEKRVKEFDLEKPVNEIKKVNSAVISLTPSKDSKEAVSSPPIQRGKKQPLKRKIPPISMIDTIRCSKNPVTGERFIESAHGSGALFKDEEILAVHSPIRNKVIDKVEVGYSQFGKAIIQQQATRGCTAATAAMLIDDNGKGFDPDALRSRNLGRTEDQVRDIAQAGLDPIVSNISKDLQTLSNLIKQNGSAIVSIDGELGGHVIVVDEVSDDFKQVRLRDPYHGWEITVTADAFSQRYSGGEVIQVKK